MDIEDNDEREYKKITSGDKVPVPDTEIQISELPKNTRTPKMVIHLQM